MTIPPLPTLVAEMTECHERLMQLLQDISAYDAKYAIDGCRALSESFELMAKEGENQIESEAKGEQEFPGAEPGPTVQ